MLNLVNLRFIRHWTSTNPYHVAYMQCSTKAKSSKGIDLEDTLKRNEGEENSFPKSAVKKARSKKKSSDVEISALHSSRATNRFFFGPLLETSRQRKSRERRELKEKVDGQLSVSDSSATSFIKDISNTRLKKDIYFDGVDYEKFAAMYSDPDHIQNNQISSETTSKFMKGNQSEEVKKYDNRFSERSSFTSKTTKILKVKSRMSNSLHLPQNAPAAPPHIKQLNNKEQCRNGQQNIVGSKHSYFIKIDNSKFTDVPRVLDLAEICCFPLLNIKSGKNELGRNEDTQCKEHFSAEVNNIVTTIDYNSDGVKSLPSVSKILSDTMPEASRLALAKWEARMIAELGESGFLLYKKELFAQGSLLHRCIQEKLQHSTSPSVKDREQLGGYWTSIEGIVDEVEEGRMVSVLESRVIHPHLHYTGVVDCVAVYRNSPVVVEWKTSSRVKKTLQSTYDNPLQIAAYLGALQYDPSYTSLTQVQSGLLALSYQTGSNGDAHIITLTLLRLYWTKWLQRLTAFWKLHAITSSAPG